MSQPKTRLELKDEILQLKSSIRELEKQSRSNERKIKSLEAKKQQVKIVTKYKTKVEPFPPHRKRIIARELSKQYIDEKITGSFKTKISDLSKVLLTISDFSTEHSYPIRQLGIMLYASNFRSVRKKDLYDGRDVGGWYAQTIEAMLSRGVIIRTNNDMKKWIYFSLSPLGEKVVRDLNNKIKEYLT